MPSAAATFALDPALHEAMIAARRHLHAHPELSNAEEKTQAYVRTWLEAQGWGEAKAAAGAGAFIDIVGVGGSSDRKIAIRADIDELPIFEQSGEPFASRNPGVMHACGHIRQWDWRRRRYCIVTAPLRLLVGCQNVRTILWVPGHARWPMS